MVTGFYPPDWRELCRELVADYEQHLYRSELLDRARAALSQPEPEPVGLTDEELWELQGAGMFSPAEFARAAIAADRAREALPQPEPEVAGPSDGELNEPLGDLIDKWCQEGMQVKPHGTSFPLAHYVASKAYQYGLCKGRPAPPADGEVPKAALVRRMCDIILGNTFGNEELDSLALLVGHHRDVLNAPPAPVEGEVAELVAAPAGRELADTALSMLGTIKRTKLFIPEITDTIRKALELGRSAPAPAGDHALRDAAQLALTTLEGWANYDQWVWPISARTAEALSALKTALSRPTPAPVAAPLKERPDFLSGYRAGLHDGRLEQLSAHALPLPSEEVKP